MPGQPKKGFVRLVVDIPAPMKDKLAKIAESKDLSMSQYVRGMLSIALDMPVK